MDRRVAFLCRFKPRFHATKHRQGAIPQANFESERSRTVNGEIKCMHPSRRDHMTRRRLFSRARPVSPFHNRYAARYGKSCERPIQLLEPYRHSLSLRKQELWYLPNRSSGNSMSRINDARASTRTNSADRLPRGRSKRQESAPFLRGELSLRGESLGRRSEA